MSHSLKPLVTTPLTGWRLALVGAMAGGFASVMVVPFARHFFALHAPPLIVWLAAIGIAAIVWSVARFFVPDAAPRAARQSSDRDRRWSLKS